MNYIKFTFIALSSIILLAGCAQTQYDKGMYAYEKMAYKKASKHFEKYLSKNTQDQNSRILLAKSYLKMNAFDKAESNYAQAFKQAKTPLSPINKLEYAQVLAINNKKAEAKKWAKDYLRDVPDDIQTEDFIKGLDNILKEDITLECISIEDFSASFGAVPHKQSLYFVGEGKRKTTQKSNPWNGKSFLNIYLAKLDDNGKIGRPQKVAGLNSKWHDGPFCLNESADKIWLSRSALNEKSKVLRDDASTNQMYIYQLDKSEEAWNVNDATAAINKMGYSSMHPCISSDGQQLYFVSDRPGGQGDFDLYVSELTGDRWSIPKNLGRYINSKSNEGFPFLASQDSLYFASDRAGSQGGMDIYLSVKSNGQWSEAKPLPQPINSSADDFAYFATKDRQTGYISSNREKKDQIYSWSVKIEEPSPIEEPKDSIEGVPPVVEEVIPLTFKVNGVVVNKNSKEKLAKVSVQLQNEQGKVLKEIQTDENGNFNFRLEQDMIYELHAKSKNSFSRDQFIKTTGLEDSKIFKIQLELEIVEEKTTVNLKNIYYDYNAADLREEAKEELHNLMLFMKDNPSVQIQINAHTDSKGADEANLKLSEERAKSVKQFLVDAGINQDRIVAKGYGETKLVNKCDDGVNCTEEEHQANRRTEFMILKLD